MASIPIQVADTPADPRLTAEEGYDLILSLAGKAHDAYAEVGGAESWIRSGRNAWNEERSR